MYSRDSRSRAPSCCCSISSVMVSTSGSSLLIDSPQFVPAWHYPKFVQGAERLRSRMRQPILDRARLRRGRGEHRLVQLPSLRCRVVEPPRHRYEGVLLRYQVGRCHQVLDPEPSSPLPSRPSVPRDSPGSPRHRVVRFLSIRLRRTLPLPTPTTLGSCQRQPSRHRCRATRLLDRPSRYAPCQALLPVNSLGDLKYRAGSAGSNSATRSRGRALWPGSASARVAWTTSSPISKPLC